MNKKRKIDFVLDEDKYEKVIFRFYPRRSSCHSHGDEPPKSWDDVYKVYYAYAVIRHLKDDGECEQSDIMFDSGCDECSVIDEVAARCELIASGVESVTRTWHGEDLVIKLLDNEMWPSGDGVSWTISKIKNVSKFDDKEDLYRVEMFSNDNVGYRFLLYKSELAEFGNYLKECCEYMLAHGDPI